MGFNRGINKQSVSRKRFRWIGTTALSLLLMAGVHRGARAEQYFSIFMGGSQTRASDLDVHIPSAGIDATFHGVKWHEEPLEMPPYYGYKFGSFSEAHPHWGVEFEMTHFKIHARTTLPVNVTGTWKGAPINITDTLGNRVQRFDISHGVNTLGVNVLYRWMSRRSPSFPRGRVQPFVGVGGALYVLHPENTIDGVDNEQEYESRKIGWQAFSGLRYGISHKVSLFTEVRYSDGDGKVLTANGGWADTRIQTWHGQAGVMYEFK